jgi:hypothetical protein
LNNASTGSCRLPLEVYKWRHLIENFFGKLKEFKRIALRSEKTDTSFESIIYLAARSSTPDESQQALEQAENYLSRIRMPAIVRSKT